MNVILFLLQEDYLTGALEALRLETEGQILVNTEYRAGGAEFVSLQQSDKADVAKKLLSQGVVLLDQRKDKKLQTLVSDLSSVGVYRYQFFFCRFRHIFVFIRK